MANCYARYFKIMANCTQCGRRLPPLSLGKKICQWCVQHEAAQRGEVSDEEKQHVMPTPWGRPSNGPIVTQIFFGINVAVFIGMALSGISISNPTNAQLLHWGANTARLTLAGEWWRLITNVFLHIGFLHILFNMWCLWDLGALCETLYGHWTFACVYLLCGVAGSLASVAWHPGVVSAGASGAIFGIAGALIASFYLGEFSSARSLVSGQLKSLLIFAGYNLIFGAVSGHTDNAAHVGGLVAGLVLGVLIAHFAPSQSNPFPRVAVILLGLLLVMGGGFWLRKGQSYSIRIDHAEQLLQENKASEAIAELQQAARQDPQKVAAYFELAHAYYIQSQYPQAESALKSVLSIQPGNDEARYNLGMVYLKEKRFKEAQNLFRQMSDQDKTQADPHAGLGEVLAAEGNDAAALEEFKTAAKLEPNSESLYYDMGLSYFRLKQYDEAIASFLREKQINSDYSDVENALANAYEGKGMKEEAQKARTIAERLKNLEQPAN